MVRRRKKVRRKRKGPAFGGYKIRPDTNFAKIIGKRAVSPAEMTKKVWKYIKKKRLARKGRK